ncbi:unnamed protein product [Anisakis simplex]|uniref:ZP domain-containing protein n=1 Tax=Anisakis simplex TaxID=6269 RepID=A0A0M3KAK2_ANISI|nr:unnamed protein product [Anisakis simplex]
MLKKFRCSETSPVMNLIIYADIPMNISVVGYATPPSLPPTSPSPTSTHATTHASTAAYTTPPTEASRVSETVVNSTEELKYGNPVEIPVDVHPGSSYSFNITNEEDHKPTGEIQVKVTMCNANEGDAQPVNSSKDGLYEISATEIQHLIIYFNCSHKSRVKRSPGNGKYKMYLFITGTNKMSAAKNISVLGISTPTELLGTTPTPRSAKPSTSLSAGWIVGIVLMAIFVVALIIAIAIFVYFYMKRRRGSISEDREGLFKRQSFVDEVLPRTLPLPRILGDYQKPQTSSMIPATINSPSSRPFNYPQPSSNYPILRRPNIQPLEPNIASPINPVTPNNNLYQPRGLRRNY